jgi:hypothetical protein
MPYFQRKPADTLVDAVLASVPGLPSRGALAPAAALVSVGPFAGPATTTGIVEQAAAVLAAERPSASPGPSMRSDAGSIPSAPGVAVSQLREQVNLLVEQFVSLAGRAPGPHLGAPPPTRSAGPGTRSDTGLVVEPAPVVSPPGPVAPGATAQIGIALVNEDEQPAQIVFFSTALVGEDGTRIAAESISVQPRELTLAPGETGEVIVRVAIPAQARCGVYSGLIRASKIDYLHAVLVVQVEYP